MGHPYRMSYRSPWWLLRLRLSSLSAVAPLLYTERVPQKAFRVVYADDPLRNAAYRFRLIFYKDPYKSTQKLPGDR